MECVKRVNSSKRCKWQFFQQEHSKAVLHNTVENIGRICHIMTHKFLCVVLASKLNKKRPHVRKGTTLIPCTFCIMGATYQIPGKCSSKCLLCPILTCQVSVPSFCVSASQVQDTTVGRKKPPPTWTSGKQSETNDVRCDNNSDLHEDSEGM